MSNVAQTNVLARELAWRMLRDAADEDYMFARLAAKSRSKHQFVWSAAQAIEKYLKCALVLNGEVVKDAGHNFLPLFHRAQELAGSLLPLMYCPPNTFPKIPINSTTDFEPYEIIASRFQANGVTDNRYRQYSLTVGWFDLHKLDEFVFQIRRLCYPLDMAYVTGLVSFRDALLRDPNLQPHPRLYGINEHQNPEFVFRRKAFKWRNFSFFPNNSKAGRKITTGLDSQGSRIGVTVSYGGRNGDVHEALDWFTEAIHIRKKDLRQIEQLLRDKVKGTNYSD